MKDLQSMLDERHAKILELEQQISSQEASVAQSGSNLPEKASHLFNLTILVEQLHKSQEEEREHRLSLMLCNTEARYHREHAKELRSTVCN